MGIKGLILHFLTHPSTTIFVIILGLSLVPNIYAHLLDFNLIIFIALIIASNFLLFILHQCKLIPGNPSRNTFKFTWNLMLTAGILWGLSFYYLGYSMMYHIIFVLAIVLPFALASGYSALTPIYFFSFGVMSVITLGYYQMILGWSYFFVAMIISAWYGESFYKPINHELVSTRTVTTTKNYSENGAKTSVTNTVRETTIARRHVDEASTRKSSNSKTEDESTMTPIIPKKNTVASTLSSIKRSLFSRKEGDKTPATKNQEVIVEERIEEEMTSDENSVTPNDTLRNNIIKNSTSKTTKAVLKKANTTKHTGTGTEKHTSIFQKVFNVFSFASDHQAEHGLSDISLRNRVVHRSPEWK